MPSEAELWQWVNESRRRLSQPLPKDWGLVVDMRELEPLDPAARAVITEGHKEYKKCGVRRVAVVMNDPIAMLQFRHLGQESGVDCAERFINSTTTPNWRVVARQWVVSGDEPQQPT